MTIKQIRNELQALKEQLAGPAAVAGPSVLDDIEARLARLADRQDGTGEHSSAAQRADLATWWRNRFGQEMIQ